MKTKIFTLLALCLSLSLFTAKATIAADYWNFTVASKAPNGYFGGAPSFCTFQMLSDVVPASASNQYARYTRPSTASLTDGVYWGTSDVSQQVNLQVSGIAGGNASMGTNAAGGYCRYAIVKMRKFTAGAPVFWAYGIYSGYDTKVISTTPVVIGQWVSYVFDIGYANAGNLNYKMFTVIPDKDNVACVADIMDVTLTKVTKTITATSNDNYSGAVSGGGTYALYGATTTTPVIATLVATPTPNTNSRFVNWMDDMANLVSSNPSFTYNVASDKTYIANFTSGYTISASAIGGSVAGLATNGGYNLSETVDIIATPTGMNRFIGWVENGNVVSTNLEYTFTATANRTLVAVFGPNGANYTSAAPPALWYEYGTVGVTGAPVFTAQGSFAIDYVGLSAPVVIAPTTNFDISLTKNSYTSGATITINPDVNGKVPYTTIYVRLKEGLGYLSSAANTLIITSTGMTNVNVALTGSVSKKPLYVVNPCGAAKTYDNTTAATITGTLYGNVSGDNVTIATGTFAAATVNVQAAAVTGIGGQTITGTLGGTKSANYTIASYIYDRINPITLTSTDAALTSKVYDGTTSTTAANFSGTNLSANILAADAGLVAFPVTSGTYADANVGTGKTVKAILTGTKAANYSLVITNGAITAKALTITTPVTANKVYDGTNAATITGTLTGLITADVPNVSLVGTGTFADALIGVAKSVTSTAKLGGSAAGNYSLTPLSGLTADITAKALTITTPVAANKVYDGTNSATITGTLTGVVASDAGNVTLNGTGTFVDAVVGMSKAVTSTATLGGSAAGNYSLTQPTGLVANILWGITATVNDPSYGNVTGAGNFDNNATVTLIATNTGTYHFINWTENNVEVSTNSTYSFPATSNRSLVANFSFNTNIDQLNEGSFVMVKDHTIRLLKAANSIHIYNSVGECLLSKQNVSEGSSLSITDTGVYFVKVNSEKGIKVQKIIIQ